MKIHYGSPIEKHLLAAGFLCAAAAALAVLALYDLLRLPYLRLPAFLGISALLMGLFPLRLLHRSRRWNGLYRAAPALLIMAAVSLGSSFSFPSEDSASVSDYLFHGGEFFAVGLLMARMVDPVPGNRSRLLPVLLALAGVLTFGLLDEFHQSFVPDRNPSLRDLRSDMLGGGAGILVYTFLFSHLLTPARSSGKKNSTNEP
jgi:VanZ family protein